MLATVNSYLGVAAVRGSGGAVADAADPEIRRAQRDLASEGVFVEPASAVALAGLRRLHARGDIARGARVVIVSTSGGLKNLETQPAEAEPAERPVSIDALAAVLGD